MMAMTSHKVEWGLGTRPVRSNCDQSSGQRQKLVYVSPQHRASSIVGKRTTRLWIVATLDYSYRIAGG